MPSPYHFGLPQRKVRRKSAMVLFAIKSPQWATKGGFLYKQTDLHFWWFIPEQIVFQWFMGILGFSSIRVLIFRTILDVTVVMIEYDLKHSDTVFLYSLKQETNSRGEKNKVFYR